jgi:hypothetical protein
MPFESILPDFQGLNLIFFLNGKLVDLKILFVSSSLKSGKKYGVAWMGP